MTVFQTVARLILKFISKHFKFVIRIKYTIDHSSNVCEINFKVNFEAFKIIKKLKCSYDCSSNGCEINFKVYLKSF